MEQKFFCKLTLNNGVIIDVKNSKDGVLDQDVVNAALVGYQKSAIVEANIGTECKEIGFHTFFNAANLQKVTLSNTITSIGASAFFYCKSLQSITIPNSVKLIENYAFDTCLGLTEIVIPEKVDTIRRKAFGDCRELKSITLKASTPPEMTGSSAFDGSDCPIYVPLKALERYKKNKYWKYYKTRIKPIK